MNIPGCKTLDFRQCTNTLSTDLNDACILHDIFMELLHKIIIYFNGKKEVKIQGK